jgi:hypothetical protein
MYFDESQPVADQRAAVDGLWTNMQTHLVINYTWTVQTSGRELNTASGALEDFWTEGTAHTGTGFAGTGTSVADATQVLCRWRTNSIIGGRRLQGRTFVPGLTKGSLSGGNLSASAQGDIASACATFVNDLVGFQVWHRPVGGTGGSAAPVTGSAVWNELAVQRKRRG